MSNRLPVVIINVPRTVCVHVLVLLRTWAMRRERLAAVLAVLLTSLLVSACADRLLAGRPFLWTDTVYAVLDNAAHGANGDCCGWQLSSSWRESCRLVCCAPAAPCFWRVSLILTTSFTHAPFHCRYISLRFAQVRSIGKTFHFVFFSRRQSPSLIDLFSILQPL